ncbi:MAG: transcriptional regulator [Bacillota bacterium]
MAELEDKERFAELLALGITALKQHPDYKTKRKKRETLPSGQFSSESFINKIAYQLGISSNTIKSWMGQMGVKYIPSRIEDSKLFGIVWLIIEKSGLDAVWFTDLLRTTSIPVIDPPLPVWVASCLSKAKLLRDDEFGAPSDQEIEAVKTRLFDGISQPQKPAVPAAPAVLHNLPTRWSDSFVGRKHELEAIRHWLTSPSPVCLISGWGGMGKTTIALESAYACVGEPHGEAASEDLKWPPIACVIWISADLKSLNFGDFLDIIAYQLGRVELLGKSLNEKWFVVRNALSSYSDKMPVLLIIDSIDTADYGISEFIVNLPQGVKVLLTARENQQQIEALAGKEIYTIQLDGLLHSEALEYLASEVQHHIRLSNVPRKKAKLEQLLAESVEVHLQLIDATAGNPKAIALSIAHMTEDDIPIRQLIADIGKAGYSLSALFEYLFGRTWERCSEDARRLWQVLCFFGRPASEESWGAAAGLDGRRFFLAIEQLRGCALIETERVDGQLHYRAHQTVLAYGERYLSENKTFESEARQRWSQYYIDYLDTYLKRDKPEAPYWNCLLGRDLERVKREWPNIAKLMEWASAEEHSELLIQLMLRLSHFLSRVNLPMRIEYGLKAARAALSFNRETLSSLFLIDTVGWALLEIGLLDEGLRRIEAGLRILEELDPSDPEVQDLKVLGLAFKAKYYLKTDQREKVAEILDVSRDVYCTPLIKHRILLIRGDLCLQNGEFSDAIHCYEQANEVSKSYGGEKTIEAYFNLGISYVKCSEYEKAESAFDQLLYNRSKANQIELIYYQYGMAQLLHRKGNNAEALLLTQKTLAIIDSWERTIWLREEVERFHAMLTDAC